MKKKQEVVIMASNTPNNRLEENAADQQLIDGLTKVASTIPNFVFGGAPVPTKDVVTTLQARLVTAKAAESARVAWRAAVQADRDERAKTKALISVVKQTLLQYFAGQADTLATFGLTPRKPRAVKPETKVVAAAKAKATRTARHTLGKKQKADIKGALDSSVITIPVPGPTPIPATPATAAPTPTQAPTQPAPTTSPAVPVTPTAPAHGS
jgi:hypothetical protein